MSNKNIVIFDLDGTLADLGARVHHVRGETQDWNAFYGALSQDTPIAPVIALYRKLWDHTDYDIVILTGRPERYRHETLAWLARHDIPVKRLLMRQDGDDRHDDVVKEDVLREIQAQGQDVAFVVEDRNSVVAMWRRNGVLCLQCAEGNF